MYTTTATHRDCVGLSLSLALEGTEQPGSAGTWMCGRAWERLPGLAGAEKVPGKLLVRGWPSGSGPGLPGHHQAACPEGASLLHLGVIELFLCVGCGHEACCPGRDP